MYRRPETGVIRATSQSHTRSPHLHPHPHHFPHPHPHLLHPGVDLLVGSVDEEVPLLVVLDESLHPGDSTLAPVRLILVGERGIAERSDCLQQSREDSQEMEHEEGEGTALI